MVHFRSEWNECLFIYLFSVSRQITLLYTETNNRLHWISRVCVSVCNIHSTESQTRSQPARRRRWRRRIPCHGWQFNEISAISALNSIAHMRKFAQRNVLFLPINYFIIINLPLMEIQLKAHRADEKFIANGMRWMARLVTIMLSYIIEKCIRVYGERKIPLKYFSKEGNDSTRSTPPWRISPHQITVSITIISFYDWIEIGTARMTIWMTVSLMHFIRIRCYWCQFAVVCRRCLSLSLNSIYSSNYKFTFIVNVRAWHS